MTADVLLVGCGNMARGYLDAARRLGLRVAVVETPDRVEAVRREYGDVVVAHASADATAEDHDEVWAGPALGLAARTRPRGVLAFSEPHVLAAALVAEAHGLPGPGLYAAQVSRNKALQRQLFGAAGVPQPHSRLVESLDETDLPDFPVVIKPLSSFGSRGVEQVRDARGWSAAVAGRRGGGPFLVEEYATGEEYSWEGLVQGGRTVFRNLTVKTTTGPPAFVELQHVPSGSPEAAGDRQRAARLGAEVIDAMRMRDGLIHLEFRVADDGRIAVMEAAVRTPGCYLLDVVSRAHGVDLYEACLRLALGEKPELPPEGESFRHTASVFLAAERPGEIVPEDTSVLDAVPGVFRSGLRQEPGTVMNPPESNLERMAFALLDLPTETALQDAIRTARTAFASSPTETPHGKN
ncbi:ATP-grasp domain-containing protein [Streptomyces sp. NPDC126499]|uniref:ATP-grasp domain-containing protein n=1 Tax=Streptomyces sp. NPDC126499 TaxID=3155314 RepID=UPI00331C71F5